MKKSILAAVIVLASGSAFAAGIGGGVVIGGVAHGWDASVVGKTSSISNGNSVAASQIAGSGKSFQHTDAVSGGSATIGGNLNASGATVFTHTDQFSTVNSIGKISGVGAMAEQTIGKNTTILNGTMGFGSSENMSKGKSNFEAGQIGGVIGIGGIAGIGGF